jgi:hypothetical protein
LPGGLDGDLRQCVEFGRGEWHGCE